VEAGRIVIATTRASVYRGETTDELGDEVDDNETPLPGLNDVAVSIIERSANRQDPNTGMWLTIQVATLRLRAGLDVRVADRVKDNRTGRFYLVDDAHPIERSIAGRATRSYDLSILETGIDLPGTPAPTLGSLLELTQAEYDALAAAGDLDPNTFYAITD
jgi:hypothetical protein